MLQVFNRPILHPPHYLQSDKIAIESEASIFPLKTKFAWISLNRLIDS